MTITILAVGIRTDDRIGFTYSRPGTPMSPEAHRRGPPCRLSRPYKLYAAGVSRHFLPITSRYKNGRPLKFKKGRPLIIIFKGRPGTYFVPL